MGQVPSAVAMAAVDEIRETGALGDRLSHFLTRDVGSFKVGEIG